MENGMTPLLKNVYIAFPEGKHKVLTMSYDDGRMEDYRLVELFNRYNIKGTFHLNSGRQDDPRRIPVKEYRELYRGHEISAHTHTHPTIERSPLSQVAQQVLLDRKMLEDLAGYPVRGLSYPNGSYSKEIVEMLPALGIRYARVVGNTDAFALPENFLTWKATCHHNHRLLELADQFLALDKTQYLYCMYVWGHSYEFTDCDNWDLIEEFCRRVSGQENIWYATNIEIADYMDAAKRLEFSVDASMIYNPSACPVWVYVGDLLVEVKGGETVKLQI